MSFAIVTAKLAAVLRQWAEWLDPTPPPPPDAPELVAARNIVRSEQASSRRAAYKRAVVLARLRDQFPERRKRDLVFVIEQAVQELP